MSYSLTEPIDEPMDRSGHLTPADQIAPTTGNGSEKEPEPELELEPGPDPLELETAKTTTTTTTTSASARTSVPRRILDPGNFNSTNLCLFDD